MNTIKETGQEARQGEISPHWPMLKVLLVSTSVAGLVLFIAAVFFV